MINICVINIKGTNQINLVLFQNFAILLSGGHNCVRPYIEILFGLNNSIFLVNFDKVFPIVHETSVDYNYLSIVHYKYRVRCLFSNFDIILRKNGRGL